MNATIPLDMAMYWTSVYHGDWINPPEPAPIWEFVDDDEIPNSMSFVDADGLVIVEVGR